jgi:hypothetical protein
MSEQRIGRLDTWLLILLAGAVAGLAEVFWILMQSGSAVSVGAGVAATFTGDTAVTTANGWLGLGIHMGLSIMLAAAFILLIWRPLRSRMGSWETFAMSVVCLAGVWAFNFMVLLPVVNPAFLDLLPMGVTLTSKLLFGVAMGGLLAARQRGR